MAVASLNLGCYLKIVILDHLPKNSKKLGNDPASYRNSFLFDDKPSHFRYI
jgi:hypothetical protein